jgi:hypothetical protein
MPERRVPVERRCGRKSTVSGRHNPADLQALTLTHREPLFTRCAALVARRAEIYRIRSAPFRTSGKALRAPSGVSGHPLPQGVVQQGFGIVPEAGGVALFVPIGGMRGPRAGFVEPGRLMPNLIGVPAALVRTLRPHDRPCRQAGGEPPPGQRRGAGGGERQGRPAPEATQEPVPCERGGRGGPGGAPMEVSTRVGRLVGRHRGPPLSAPWPPAGGPGARRDTGAVAREGARRGPCGRPRRGTILLSRGVRASTAW